MGLNESIRDMLSGEVYVQTADIRECAVTTAKLADNAVTSAKIAECALATADIADSSVTTVKLGNSAVTTAKLGNSSVTTAILGNSAVTSAKLGNSAVTTAKIQDSAVTSTQLGACAVITAKIGDSAVTTTQLGNSAVTTAKLADCAVTSAKLGSADMLGWVACAITAGGTSISTYTASGDTTILHVALQITTEASADVCTISISGGGTDFLIGAKATAPITHQCSGICTLSSGSTIAAVMTATVSDEIAGKLQINRIVFI